MTEKLDYDDQIKLLQEQKKQRKLEEAEQRRQEKQKERDEVEKWNNFVRAEEVLADTDMKFFRDGAPKYFRKLVTRSKDKKTGVSVTNTEIKFYPPGSLQENWIQLKNPGAKDMFRVMVEGGELTLKDPETGKFFTKTYESKVYDKITNTLKDVDEKTYNLLTLDDRLYPEESDEKETINDLHLALVYAISGNVIRWDRELNTWVGDKEENRVWLEKWIYGTVYADIGNPSASLPVIFGAGKVGKNALFDILLKQMLGKDAVFSSTWDVLHGNFDGFKMGKVCMFIDEVPAREDWSSFKNMTGSPDSFIKQKYGPELTVENTIRYAIGCNTETYPLPIEDGKQMMRVSPIKTSKYSTFAENVVLILDQKYGKDSCKIILKEFDANLDVDSMSDFDIGDTLLRRKLHQDWASRDAAQQFLNYLHQTYKSTNEAYSHPPLRGKDWNDIMEDKKHSVEKTVEYVLDQEIDTITGKELYEIYKIFQHERNDSIMKYRNFSTKITGLLREQGYDYYSQRKLANDCRETIFDRTRTDCFMNYTIDMNKFISEFAYSSTDITMGKYRALKYKSDEELEKQRNLRHRLKLMDIKNR